MHNKHRKWSQEIGEEIGPDIFSFGKLHSDIYRITNIAKFRSFQYRLLQRGLVTNVNLYNWNIMPHPNCYYCNEEVETIIHLLIECNVVKTFWQEVFEWLKMKYKKTSEGLRNTTIDIIQNTVSCSITSIINFIILLAKFYIYRQKWIKGNLSIIAFKRYVQEFENVEMYIAIKNNNVNKHNRKWGNLA